MTFSSLLFCHCIVIFGLTLNYPKGSLKKRTSKKEKALNLNHLFSEKPKLFFLYTVLPVFVHKIHRWGFKYTCTGEDYKPYKIHKIYHVFCVFYVFCIFCVFCVFYIQLNPPVQVRTTNHIKYTKYTMYFVYFMYFVYYVYFVEGKSWLLCLTKPDGWPKWPFFGLLSHFSFRWYSELPDESVDEAREFYRTCLSEVKNPI